MLNVLGCRNMYGIVAQYVFVGAMIVWLLSILKESRLKRTSLFRPELESIIEGQGCKLLSVEIPERFDSGPFPAPSGTVSHGAAVVMLDYGTFRIVRFQDDEGKEHLAWARLFFNGSVVENIEWKPDLKMTQKGEQGDKHKA